MSVYTHDQPTSQGMANVLKRAYVFSHLRWMPIAPMPRTPNCKEETPFDRIPPIEWEPWRPEHGLPYSSVRFEEKFIGINVSLETFYSALANPRSVLYTRNLTGQGKRMSAWYGTVCSAFVSYALDLPGRRSCNAWGTYDDMPLIPVTSAQDIHLADAMVSPIHATLITDVARDENGKVVEISVTESIVPFVVCNTYSAEEFEHYWLPRGFKIYRYQNIDKVTYTPSPYLHLEGDPDLPAPVENKTLLPDYGDKANYRLGEPVELNVMEEGWEKLVVENEAGEKQCEFLVRAPGVRSYTPEQPGLYRAYCLRGEEKSRPVTFCMTDFKVTAALEGSTATFDLALADGDRVLTFILSRHSDRYSIANRMLTQEESDARRLTVENLKPDTYEIKLIAKNDYGQYCSSMILLEVK